MSNLDKEFGPEKLIEDPKRLAVLRARNNPGNKPVGHFTGRCSNCHSRDLWDDATAYGCRCCGAIYFTG